MKKTLIIFSLLLLSQPLTAQVISQDSSFIDNIFDEIDLVVIPHYEFINARVTIDYLKGQEYDGYPLSDNIDLNILQGGGLSVGLRHKKMELFISYYTTWNVYADDSYETPYYAANSLQKLGDSQIKLTRIQSKSHYWITENFGLGLEYELFFSDLDVVQKRGYGLTTRLINFSIAHHSIYLYAPLKYNINEFNFNSALGVTVYAKQISGAYNGVIVTSNNSFVFNTPSGLKFTFGVNTKLFGFLPFGVMYKYQNIFSTNEYSYVTNIISLQIGIPEL